MGGGSTQVAIKRLKKEFDEVERSKGELPFTVHPLEDNFLEWHFTLQGPDDSAYAGGLYHGRLIFPPDYPFSAPNLMFVTPSGRFQTNTKICLTVTGFHPEHWQPAWGVRTMLIAIRDHFTTEDKGAIGYLGHSKEERAQSTIASRTAGCKACGYHPPPLSATSSSKGTGLENQLFDPNVIAASQGIKRPTDEPISVSYTLLISIAFAVVAFFLANYYFYTGQ